MDEVTIPSARLTEMERQLAEKNRELEIEAALETVRSRTMTMQHSDELMEVANLLFLQVRALQIHVQFA